MTDEATKDELYAEAQALEIEGRSAMDKEELATAIRAAKRPWSQNDEEVVEFAAEEAPVIEEPVVEKVVAAEEEPVVEVELEEVEEAPVVSEGPTTQGGSTFLTDRSQ